MKLTQQDRHDIRRLVNTVNEASKDSRVFAGGLQTFAWLIEQRLAAIPASSEVQERFKDKRLLGALWEKCQKDGGFSWEEVLRTAQEEPPETGDLRYVRSDR